MKTILYIEKMSLLFLTIIFTMGIYFANTDIAYFDKSFTVEDGFVESGSAIFLFLSSLLLFYRLIKLKKHKTILWKIGVFLMAALFLFGAGEEISWGQRLFNFNSSQFFIENNAQAETNIHNMVVGKTNINKLIFSQLLTLFLILYLLILPFLYKKTAWIKKLTDSFGVPVVKWRYTIYFLAVTALIFLMPSSRKWELYELAFGVIFFLIILNPMNKNIYAPNP